jgi:hypothetical protein
MLITFLHDDVFLCQISFSQSLLARSKRSFIDSSSCRLTPQQFRNSYTFEAVDYSFFNPRLFEVVGFFENNVFILSDVTLSFCDAFCHIEDQILSGNTSHEEFHILTQFHVTCLAMNPPLSKLYVYEA